MINPTEEYTQLFAMIVPEGIVREVLVKEAVKIAQEYADHEIWSHDFERDEMGCPCGD
jgi:hypothetical protein